MLAITIHTEDNVMNDLLVSDTLTEAFNIAVEFIKENPNTSLSIVFTNYFGDIVAKQWSEGTSALRSRLDVSDISLNGDEMARLFQSLAADTISKKRDLERHVFKIESEDSNQVFGYKIGSQREYRQTCPRYSISEGFAFPSIKF
jgi:hypothetical protein